MNMKPILDLARKHVAATPEHEGSARLCLSGAIDMYDAGFWEDARANALLSLSYSIGVTHRDYQRAAKGEI